MIQRVTNALYRTEVLVCSPKGVYSRMEQKNAILYIKKYETLIESWDFLPPPLFSKQKFNIINVRSSLPQINFDCSIKRKGKRKKGKTVC